MIAWAMLNVLAAVTVGTPKWEGDAITCLNKRFEIDAKTSNFRLTVDGDAVLKGSYWHLLKGKALKSNVWISGASYAQDGSGANGLAYRQDVARDARTRAFDAYVTGPGVSWRQCRVEYELIPDGLIRVAVEGFPCPNTNDWNFIHRDYFLGVPPAAYDTFAFTLNGKREDFTRKSGQAACLDLSRRDGELTLFADDPSRAFTIRAKANRGRYDATVIARASGEMVVSFNAACRREFFIDIRSGSTDDANAEKRGGIDFMRIERLRMPDDRGRNLLPNASFECGLKGWNGGGCSGGMRDSEWYPGKWDKTFYAIDETERVSGTRSLRLLADYDPNCSARPGGQFETHRVNDGAVGMSSMPVVLDPGVYTVSFYMKAAKAGTLACVWCPSFSWATPKRLWKGLPNQYQARSEKAFAIVEATTQWQRFSFTFTQEKGDPMWLCLNAWNRETETTCWFDDFQIEKGSEATAFERPVAEAALETSDPENFVDSGKPIAARLRIATRTPSCAGKVTVKARLADGTRLYEKPLPFASDATGVARVALDGFEGLGDGLFVLEYDFGTAAGVYRQFDRLTRVKWMTGDFKWRRLFMNDYGDCTCRSDLYAHLARLQKIGMSGTYNVPLSRVSQRVCAKYGIRPSGAILCSRFTYEFPDPAHPGRTVSRLTWGVCERGDPEAGPRRNGCWNARYGKDPKCPILIFNHKDEGVPLDEAYLARFREACRKRAALHPEVKIWELSSEHDSMFPLTWWNEKGDAKARARDVAKYLKAFVEGVHDAGTGALAMTESPCNMSAPGVREIQDELDALAELGARVDGIAAHPYRFSPSNPDLDADIATLMDHLKKLGYPDTTPFYFGEMMHWQMYEVPVWGTQCSSWSGVPRSWVGPMGLSYDLGKTERRSAAWRARSWLVGFKYADRVLGMQSGNHQNFELDNMYTPTLSQIVSAVLARLFGNATFVADIRFAPYAKAFVFEDGAGAPVAAVWCDKEDVDFERETPPVAEAVFGDALLGAYEISGHFFPAAELGAQAGRLKFALSGLPRYYAFRAGTTAAVCAALRRATVTGGTSRQPVRVHGIPAARGHRTGAVAQGVLLRLRRQDVGTRLCERAGPLARRPALGMTRTTLVHLSTLMVERKEV